MGRKRTKAMEGDRAVNTRTGETATIVDVYPKADPPNYAVMLDAGHRRSIMWKGSEVEWSEGTYHACYRCGDEGHGVIWCPYGDVGAHLSTEGRKALESLGLDPRRQPGASDGEDAYDGIRLWTLPSRKHMYAQMRRRVCELDGVVVDGHDIIDGSCRHCGARPSEEEA